MVSFALLIPRSKARCMPTASFRPESARTETNWKKTSRTKIPGEKAL
jgi:hypothetical protein